MLVGVIESVSKRQVAAIILLIVLFLFAPFAFIRMYGAPAGHQPTPFSIIWLSYTWALVIFNSGASEVIYATFFHQFSGMFVLQLPFRAIFVFEGFRFSAGRSNLLRIGIIGLLGDLSVTLPLAIFVFSSWYSILIPLPVMTLAGVPLLQILRVKHVMQTSATVEVHEERIFEANKAFFITLFFFLLVILLPYLLMAGIDYANEPYLLVESVLYRIGLTGSGPYFYTDPWFIFAPLYFSFIYQIPRFLVVIFAYAHFAERISLKRVIIIGIVLEILSGIPYTLIRLSAPLLGFTVPLPLLSLGILVISKILDNRQATSNAVSNDSTKPVNDE